MRASLLVGVDGGDQASEAKRVIEDAEILSEVGPGALAPSAERSSADKPAWTHQGSRHLSKLCRAERSTALCPDHGLLEAVLCGCACRSCTLSGRLRAQWVPVGEGRAAGRLWSRKTGR